jgi:hypothetical protein
MSREVTGQKAQLCHIPYHTINSRGSQSLIQEYDFSGLILHMFSPGDFFAYLE